MAINRKHKRREDRSRHSLYRLYLLVCGVLIAGALLAGSAVFFKAHYFEVEGNQRYSAEELLAASQIKEGDNLLTIPRGDIERRMEQEMPYLKDIKVVLVPPEKVLLRVEETKVAGAVETADGYWFIDCSGKILEKRADAGEHPIVTGLTPIEPAAGLTVTVDPVENLKVRGLQNLLTALEKHGISDQIQSIDVTSSSHVTMLYQQQLTVKMGLADDFDYDLKMLRAAEESYLAENWNETDTGTLDMTGKDGEAVLRKD